MKNADAARHADGGGLYLLVKETGSRSWVLRFMLKGKARDLGLGPASGTDAISLQDASPKATERRLQVKAGIDPLLDRQEKAAEAAARVQAAKAASTTFKDAAERCIADNPDNWRNSKHRQQWQNALGTYVYPVVGDLPDGEVGKAHVLNIPEPIWKTKPETASRVRGRIETVLDAASARELRFGGNPARWRGHLSHVLPKRSRLTRGHHKAIASADLPASAEQLRGRRAMAALAPEFTILTAAGTWEAIGATRDEIDLVKKAWTVPPHRMKAAREYRAPLSPRAVELLKGLRATGAHFLFTGERGGKLSAMAMLLRRRATDVTAHGFRSAFRDRAAECTAYPNEVCEAALAHTKSAYRHFALPPLRQRAGHPVSCPNQMSTGPFHKHPDSTELHWTACLLELLAELRRQFSALQTNL